MSPHTHAHRFNHYMLPDVANYEEALALAVTDAEIEQASTHIHIHIHMNEEIEQACTCICTHTYERRGDRAGLPPRPASLSLTPLCVTHRPLLCVTCGSGTRPKVGLFGRALARSTGSPSCPHKTDHTRHRAQVYMAADAMAKADEGGICGMLASCFGRLRTP